MIEDKAARVVRAIAKIWLTVCIAGPAIAITDAITENYPAFKETLETTGVSASDALYILSTHLLISVKIFVNVAIITLPAVITVLVVSLVLIASRSLQRMRAFVIYVAAIGLYFDFGSVKFDLNAIQMPSLYEHFSLKPDLWVLLALLTAMIGVNALLFAFQHMYARLLEMQIQWASELLFSGFHIVIVSILSIISVYLYDIVFFDRNFTLATYMFFGVILSFSFLHEKNYQTLLLVLIGDPEIWDDGTGPPRNEFLELVRKQQRRY